MVRGIQTARGKRRAGFGSTLALALALTAGAAVGVVGVASPAHAQKSKQEKPKYSKGFVAAYEPVNKAYNAVEEGGDYSAVKGSLPAIVAAVENEDDRNAAGQMVLLVGNKISDPLLQRQGLELMLASGKVAPEQVGQFHFFVGNLAFQAKDYAAARTALQAALAAGYTDEQSHALILESYFQNQAATEGLAYLAKVANEHAAAGKAVPESWLIRGLQVAYEQKLASQSNEVAALLVQANPTPKNWQTALQVVREVNAFDNEGILDLSRLMLVSGAIQRDYDLAEYIEAADPRKLPNEVLTALETASAAGVIPADAGRFAELRKIAMERAKSDREETPGLKGEARSAASGTVALGVADSFLSFGAYAEAEEMYQLAVDKGGIDANRALTRKGIAQVRQGKVAEAKATFGQVQGQRALLARLWTIYADDKGSAAGG